MVTKKKTGNQSLYKRKLGTALLVPIPRMLFVAICTAFNPISTILNTEAERSCESVEMFVTRLRLNPKPKTLNPQNKT